MGTCQGTPGFHALGNGRRIHRHRKANIRGKVLETAYQVSEQDGKLFIGTGFAILLTYDKERDRIILSPGGEYKRVINPKNKKR